MDHPSPTDLLGGVQARLRLTQLRTQPLQPCGDAAPPCSSADGAVVRTPSHTIRQKERLREARRGCTAMSAGP